MIDMVRMESSKAVVVAKVLRTSSLKCSEAAWAAVAVQEAQRRERVSNTPLRLHSRKSTRVRLPKSLSTEIESAQAVRDVEVKMELTQHVEDVREEE